MSNYASATTQYTTIDPPTNHQGMHQSVALLKSILMQKKNYENSNISLCKNIYNLQKNPLKETKILQDIITL
jgi:hypothetical protein